MPPPHIGRGFKPTLPVLLFVLFGMAACNNEEELDPVSQTEVTELVSRTDDMTESEAINMHIQEVLEFYNQVNLWRESPVGTSTEASEVIEHTEISINMLIGNPTQPFMNYSENNIKIDVPAHENWTPSNVVNFFELVKDFLLDNLSENDALVALSLGNPDENNQVEAIAVIGHTAVDHSDVIIGDWDNLPSISSHDKRWAPEPEGFTNPTVCDGAANFIIGAEVNREIGVYNAINAGPLSGGNTPLPGRIVTRLVYGDHSLQGTQFPNGAGIPRVYNIATVGTSLQDEHYNDVEIGGADPDWNCLTISEIIQFTFGNFNLADNGEQFVPPATIFGSFTLPRQLVCTGVGSFFGGALTPGTLPIGAKVQDHATRHYWGVVIPVIVIEPDLPVLQPTNL